MFGIGSSKTPPQPTLIFDIGSGSVGAALVDCAPKCPTILWTLRQELPFQEKIVFDRLFKGMLGALSVVAQSAAREGLPKLGVHPLKDIVAVFASPWYISQTVVLKKEEKEPIAVAGHFNEVKQFLLEKEKAMQGGTPGGTAVLLEQNIIHTALNGYPTAKPHGKRARTMETAVFVSMLGKDVDTEVRNAIERALHRSLSSAHSFALVSFAAIRDLFQTEEDFLLLDIGAEVADMGLVRKGVLLETGSFPKGRNFVLRSVAETLKTIPAEAAGRIELYRAGKSDTVESKRIAAALAEVGGEWQKAFGEGLQALGKDSLLPRTVFITADADLSEWFRVAVLGSQVRELTLSGEPFTAVLISPEQLKGHVAFQGGVTPDPFFALEALFVHKAVQSLIV